MAALLVASAAVLVTVGPNLAYLGDYVFGASGSDAAKHVWGVWWVQRSVLLGEGIPLHHSMLDWPDHAAFFCLDAANALLALPLHGLGSTLAHNLLMIAHLIAAAMGAWWLARTLKIDSRAAWLAGVVFALSPFVLTQGLASGVAEVVFLAPMPVVLIGLLRICTQPGWRWPVATAATLAILGAGGWTYALEAGGLAALMIVLRPALDAEDPLRAVRLNRPTLLRIGATLALLIPVLIPLFLAVQGTVDSPDAAYERGLSIWPGHLPQSDRHGPDGPMSDNAWTRKNVFGLVDLFIPGQAGLQIEAHQIDILIASAYAGFTTLGLAIFAAMRTRTGKVWLGVAAGFFTLSLGPVVHLDHAKQIALGPNLVYDLVWLVVPLFHELRHTVDRLTVGMYLALAIGAAIGLDHVLRALPKNRRTIAALAATAAVLVETLSVSPAPWPIPHTRTSAHPITEVLADGPAGALIDMPYYRLGTATFSSDVLIQQIHHERPVPWGLHTRPDPSASAWHGLPGGEPLASKWLSRNAFFDRLSAEMVGIHPLGRACEGAEQLGQAGFAVIVLRDDELPEAIRRDMAHLLDTCLARGEHVAGRQVWWVKNPIFPPTSIPALPDPAPPLKDGDADYTPPWARAKPSGPLARPPSNPRRDRPLGP